MNRRCAYDKCGKDFTVPRKNPNKQFCDRYCANKARRTVLTVEQAEKDCKTCGTRLVHRVYANGRCEPLPIFARRQYCDSACANKGKALYQDWELVEELEHLLGTDTPDSIAKRLGYAGIDSLSDRLKLNGQTDLHARLMRLHNEYLDAGREPRERGRWT